MLPGMPNVSIRMIGSLVNALSCGCESPWRSGMISPHDQRRWRRDGWALCPGGRFRPKLLKEMRRVAWLAKRLQSAEIRASRVPRADVHRVSSIGDGFDLAKKMSQ